MRPLLLLMLCTGCPGPVQDTVLVDPDSDDGVDDDTTPLGDTDTTPPDVIDIVHVTVRTGAGLFDGTNASAELCLSEDHCLPLDHPEFDDRQRGGLDTYSFEGVGWRVSDVQQVSLSLTEGADNQYTPVCVDVRIDGAPVYCRDGITAELNEDTPTWTDPDGLAVACQTCAASTLTHGPMVGAVTADSARLWLRTDATRPVELTVTHVASGEPASVIPSELRPQAHSDFVATPTAINLQPNTEYRYSVAVDGQPGESYTFTTPPLDNTPAQHRFAFGSCARFEEQPIFGALAEYDPDLFLFLGDNHYGNATTLSDSRQFYRWSRERPERAAFLHDRSILAIWDDHDFAGDGSDGSSPARDVVKRTFLENWANPRGNATPSGDVHFRHRWGDVELFMLDTRFYRGLDGSMLGADQHEWLLNALNISDATFKLVASGTQFTSQGSNDSWAAFPSSREALFEGIVERDIEGVVLLSGDIHRTEFRRLPGAPGGYDIPELTSSPLANLSILPCGSDSEQEFCESGDHFFVGLDIDTTLADPTLTATAFNESGEARHVWVISKSELVVP